MPLSPENTAAQSRGHVTLPGATDNEFTLKEPSAKDAASKGGSKARPSNAPGSVVLRSRNPLSKESQARVVLDGKRVDWTVGEASLELPATPGEHKIVVRVRRMQRTITVLDKTIVVEGGERLDLPVLVK